MQSHTSISAVFSEQCKWPYKAGSIVYESQHLQLERISSKTTISELMRNNLQTNDKLWRGAYKFAWINQIRLNAVHTELQMSALASAISEPYPHWTSSFPIANASAVYLDLYCHVAWIVTGTEMRCYKQRASMHLFQTDGFNTFHWRIQGGRQGCAPPPPVVQILSFSCSLWQKFEK